MKFFRSKTGVTLGLSYLGLYALSWIYSVCFLLAHRARAEFNPPSVAAFPWSLLIISFANANGMTGWYQRHAASPILYATAMALLLLPGALLNAIILYLFGRLLDGLQKQKVWRTTHPVEAPIT